MAKVNHKARLVHLIYILLQSVNFLRKEHCIMNMKVVNKIKAQTEIHNNSSILMFSININ
jgi:hypothetical protein